MRNHRLESTTETRSELSEQDAKRQAEKPETQGVLPLQRDPLAQIISGTGNISSASAHASMLNRTMDFQPYRAGQSLLRLQRQYGNHYAQRVLAQARKSEKEAFTDRWESASSCEAQLRHGNSYRPPTKALASTLLIQPFAEKPHETIEKEAFATTFADLERKQILLGNWQNDFNQISLINEPLEQYLGVKLTSDDLFELAVIIAEAKFGEQIAKQMDKHRFGFYKPSQHFDNPLDANDALGMEAVPNYIKVGVKEIRDTFEKAIAAGRTRVGREYYGSALHIMEDFFAHSNFVEIALRLRGVFVTTHAGLVESGRDEGRFRLVSGIFETLDTVVSMLKIITMHMKRPPEPGKVISTGDRITLVLLKRFNRKLARLYLAYLLMIHWAKRKIPGFKLLHNVAQRIKFWAVHKVASLIDKLTTQLAKKTGTGAQISHSILNKDDPSRPLYGLARQLAVYVVKAINLKMLAVWKDPKDTAARKELFSLVDRFTSHPDKCSWWHSIIDHYKRKTKTQPKP